MVHRFFREVKYSPHVALIHVDHCPAFECLV